MYRLARLPTTSSCHARTEPLGRTLYFESHSL